MGHKNKQIIVSGCINCPYTIIWNSGDGKGIDSIVHGSCKHPSFNQSNLKEIIIDKEYLLETVGDRLIPKISFPDWCPLSEIK